MKPRKLLIRIQFSQHNVRFTDFERLVVELGFVRVDGQGSHRTYEHSRHKQARLNLQPVNGEAKPYQVRQLLKVIEEYDLRPEGGSDVK
ncbi:MAG: type II toxin-antitoxin system HicA family toxin [Phycisphaerales bacterium]